MQPRWPCMREFQGHSPVTDGHLNLKIAGYTETSTLTFSELLTCALISPWARAPICLAEHVTSLPRINDQGKQRANKKVLSTIITGLAVVALGDKQTYRRLF